MTTNVVFFINKIIVIYLNIILNPFILFNYRNKENTLNSMNKFFFYIIKFVLNK